MWCQWPLIDGGVGGRGRAVRVSTSRGKGGAFVLAVRAWYVVVVVYHNSSPLTYNMEVTWEVSQSPIGWLNAEA